jgi:acetyl-CoA decarbonylase/synthase complex subunit delta
MAFEIPKQPTSCTIKEVTIGATKDQGGTRSSVIKLGGAKAMPFQSFDGALPNPAVVAMEVFDQAPEKYPDVLKNYFADVLDKPAQMAKKCVDEYGAQCISVRLYGTHPDRSDKSPDEAVAVVKSVLESVSVPVIVTGVNHFDKNNAVMKKIAESCAGENLLLNWVETDNYKTITAAAMAYNHCVVTLSPIDVNMAKQLNILTTNMGVKAEKIIMDPMASPLGYGLDYSYTISERIRLAAFANDNMLAFPILFNVGYEVAKIKESFVPAADAPQWGDLENRAAMWEIVTATSLLMAGADLLILYNPKAAQTIQKNIAKMQG